MAVAWVRRMFGVVGSPDGMYVGLLWTALVAVNGPECVGVKARAEAAMGDRVEKEKRVRVWNNGAGL